MEKFNCLIARAHTDLNQNVGIVLIRVDDTMQKETKDRFDMVPVLLADIEFEYLAFGQFNVMYFSAGTIRYQELDTRLERVQWTWVELSEPYMQDLDEADVANTLGEPELVVDCNLTWKVRIWDHQSSIVYWTEAIGIDSFK